MTSTSSMENQQKEENTEVKEETKLLEEKPQDIFERAFAEVAPPETEEKEKHEKEKKGKARLVKSRKAKTNIRQVLRGYAYVQATYNNTIVTLTDLNGNVLVSASAGQCGFKGPKKSTAYAAGIIVQRAMEKVTPYGLREVDVFVKGVGSGREAAIRSLNARGLQILSIKDITPIPHNGARPKKRRRI